MLGKREIGNRGRDVPEGDLFRIIVLILELGGALLWMQGS
jgi:hypothetical protein